MDGFGEHDHIIDAVAELQDRVEQLEGALAGLRDTTSARIAELEDRVAALEGGGAGSGRERAGRPSRGNSDSL